MGDIFSNMSQRPSVPPPSTGMVAGGSSPQPLAFSSWITPGATCVGCVLREADAKKHERRCGGAGGPGDQPACGYSLSWVKVKETREGGGSILVSTQVLGEFCKTAGEC